MVAQIWMMVLVAVEEVLMEMVLAEENALVEILVVIMVAVVDSEAHLWLTNCRNNL
jgi:hypothetical protein